MAGELFEEMECEWHVYSSRDGRGLEEVEWWVCLICTKMGGAGGVEEALMGDWEQMGEGS